MRKPKFNHIEKSISKVLRETLDEKIELLSKEIKDFDYQENIDKMMRKKIVDEERQVCEQCGGYMEGEVVEGKMCECGNYDKMYEELEENLGKMTSKFPKKQSFDYVQEEDDVEMLDYEEEMTKDDKQEKDTVRCKYHLQNFGPDDERTIKFCGSEKLGLDKYKFSLNEKLYGKQKKLDVAEPKGKLTSADFEKLRKGKMENKEDMDMSELGESEKFIQKATKKMEKKGTTGKFGEWCKRNGLTSEEGEVTKACIDKAMKSDNPKIVKMANFAKNIKGYAGSKHKKKSVKLKESEMIKLIEKIVLEEREESEAQVKNMKKSATSKGLDKYNQIHQKDEKINQDAIKATAKKMKEYLKDGSKGEYETNPKIFPKNNGELAKMDKKAYVPSSAVKDYVDNFTAAALENLDYDEIQPNEEWVSDNIKGSSRTGNNPEWANTGESNVNKKRNEIRKKNLLAKIKRKAYNKAPQPAVIDKTDKDKGTNILMKLESKEDKKQMKINEEFERMKTLIDYSSKTQ